MDRPERQSTQENAAATQEDAAGSLVFGPFRFDLEDRALYRADAELPLPPRARDTLAFLLKTPGKVVSKEATFSLCEYFLTLKTLFSS